MNQKEDFIHQTEMKLLKLRVPNTKRFTGKCSVRLCANPALHRVTFNKTINFFCLIISIIFDFKCEILNGVDKARNESH